MIQDFKMESGEVCHCGNLLKRLDEQEDDIK
jgi:hypothetical protein